MSSLLTMENNEKMPAASGSVLIPVSIEKCTSLMQLIVKTGVHSFSLQRLTLARLAVLLLMLVLAGDHQCSGANGVFKCSFITQLSLP